MSRLNDKVGEKVGRLTVLKRAPDYVQQNGRKRVMWECVCDCGNKITVEASNLSTEHTMSCGCLVAETCSIIGKSFTIHGKTKTREWSAWNSAKQRCGNKNLSNYTDYGGRGVRMCKRWSTSFNNFFNDMGICPPKHSLDRINVNGDYTPSNCKWSSSKEQMRNRRCTPRVTFSGKYVTLISLVEKTNLPYSLVYERIRRQGWTVNKALTTPKRKRSKNVQTNVSG